MRHRDSIAAVRRRGLVLLVLLGTAPVLLPTPALAAEPESPASVLVRRIYVPAAKTAQWPTNGQPYLPIDAQRLDELLALAAANPQASQAAVTATWLEASLATDGSISGRGVLEVAAPQQPGSWLPFVPGNLQLSEICWREAEDDPLLGYWGPPRHLGMPVAAGGSLEFDWRLTPTGGTDKSSPRYELALPAGLLTTLALDLPDGKTPVPAEGSGALVLPMTEAGAEAGPSPLPARPEPLPGTTRWRITGGPGERLVWQLQERQPVAEPNRRLPAFEEQLTYDIRLSGTELTHRFLVDEWTQQRGPVVVTLPDDMVLMAAEWNGQPIAWSREALSNRCQLAIPLDQQQRPAEPHAIELRGWSPLRLGSAAPLPQMKLQDAFWSAGRMRVRLVDAVRIDDLVLRQVWQLPPAPADAIRELHFQKLQPAGSVELLLAREQAPTRLRVGRLIELSGAGSKATVVTHIEGRQGRGGGDARQVYVLRGRLIGDWRIQSVYALNGDHVEDWYVTQESGSERHLTVRFSQAADPPRNIELGVAAFRTASARDAWLTLRDNFVVEWLEAEVAVDLLAFTSDESYELEFSPLPPAVPEEELMPSLGTLLPADFSGRVFPLSEIGDVASVHLSEQNAAYHAHAILDVVDHEDEWQWTYRLECLPRRGLVDRLPIVLPHVQPDELRWKLAHEDQWRIAERFTPPGGITARVPPGSSSWQLNLPHPQSKSFTVIVEGGATDHQRVSLAPPLVLSADEQTAGGWVRSPTPSRLRVDAAGMELVASEPQLPEPSPPLHSAWRAKYDAAHDAPADSLLTVWRTVDPLVPPRAEVTRAVLQSTYAPGCPAQHRYLLTIANTAEARLICELPPAATDIRWQAASPEAVLPQFEDSSRFEIPLALDQAAAAYVIEFNLPGEELTSGGRRAAPWPTLSVPVAVGEWHVHVPAEFQVASPQLPAREVSWQRRLFGPLAGPAAASASGTAADGRQAFRSVRLQCVHAAPLQIRFVHLPTRQTARAVVLLLALAVGYGLWRWPRQFVLLLVAAGMAALLLPASAYGWATAVWAGLLLAGGVRGLRAVAVALSSVTANSTSAPLAGRVAAIGGLVVLALTAGGALAETPIHEPRIENILIPVDGEGRLAGPERFATQQLLRELLARERRSQARGEWVILAANYQTALQADAGDTQLNVGTLHLTYELQTTQREVEVELPLVRDDARWDDQVFVDGVEVPLAWNANGVGCRFRVLQPGRYQVRLTCLPNVQVSETHQEVRVRIPPVPTATLQLDAPETAGDLQVLGRTLVRESGAAERRTATLDLRSEFSLRWPRKTTPDRSAAWQVDQWEWLHLSLNEAYIDGFFRIRGANDKLPRLELTSSQPARWVPLTGPPATGSAEPVASETSWMLTAEADPVSGEDRVYVARFRLVLDRVQPLGRIRFPQLQLRDVTTESRRLGVSYSDELAVSIDSASPPTSDVRDDSFAEHWPDMLPPDMAVTTSLSGSPVVVAVRPARTIDTPEETLQVGCFPQQLRVRYQGNFPVPVEPQTHHVIRVSPALDVVRVEANQGGRPTAVRTSRPQPDRLVLFFDEPMSEPFRLTIDATAPLLSETAALPQLTTWSGSPATGRLTLFCAPSVAVRWLTADAPPRLSETLLLPPEDWEVYGVGTFQIATRRNAPLEFEIVLNNPQFEAALVTTLVREQGKWIAELGLVVDVLQDTLSHIVLELPESLAGDPEVSPSAYLSSEPASDPARWRLRVRPLTALQAGEQYRATFRMPLKTSNPLEMEYPVVGVLGARNVDRYYGVVALGEGNWNWQGVERTVAPAHIETFLVGWPQARLLKATGREPAVVRWAAPTDEQTSRELPLVEVDARLTPRGAATLRSDFALPALGDSEYELRLPPGQELLSVRVDGRSAVLEPLDAGGFRLRLPGRQLPHLVTAITAHHLDVPWRGAVELRIPQLRIHDAPLRPQHVIWNVADLTAATEVTSTQAETLSAVEQAALRLNQLLKTSAIIATEVEVASAARFAGAANWAQVLSNAEGALQRALADSTQAEPTLVLPDATLTEYDELLARTQLIISDFRRLAEASAEWQSNSVATGAILPSSRSSSSYVLASDDPLRLWLAPRAAGDGPARWAMAAGMLLAAVVLLTTANRFSWRPSAVALLCPVSIAIGLTWWLWLWPAWVGIAVASVAAISWVRGAPFGRTSSRESTSTDRG